MKLGIIINTGNHLRDLIGISRAAIAKGHEVAAFNMDDGTRMLSEPDFNELCKLKGFSACYCDHSAGILNVSKEGIPAEIVCGSQYNNAVMVDTADKVIVL